MKRYTEKSFLPEASDYNHKAYCEGVEHYKNKNFKRAKSAFEDSLEYWPQDPQAWNALGNCFDELNKPSRAEKCFKKALQYVQEEKKSDIYFNLGNSLFDQNKFSDAIECYLKVNAQSSSVYWPAQRNMELAKKSGESN